MKDTKLQKEEVANNTEPVNSNKKQEEHPTSDASNVSKEETPKASKEEASKEGVKEEIIKEEVSKDDSKKDEVSSNQEASKDSTPNFLENIRVGNTVRVFYKIIEGGKERTQPFEGIIISKKGMGISQTFTVRRVGAGHIGVERIFPVYSPKIVDIKVLKRAKVRRAKLYYLRNLKGRRESKLKELKK